MYNDFFATNFSDDDINDMYNYLYNEASKLSNKKIVILVHRMLEDNKNELLTTLTPFSAHHSCKGGLLKHICEVYDLAKAISDVIPCNKEILYASAIIHDIAKAKVKDDFVVSHETLGTIYIDKICDELKIDNELRLLLEHMMLSHHGKPEFGSPVQPATLEAMILHMCDAISAKSAVYNKISNSIEPGTISENIPYLENIRVYRPSENFYDNFNKY